MIKLTVEVSSRKEADRIEALLVREGLQVQRRDLERFWCHWCGGEHGRVCPVPAEEGLP